MNSTIRWINTSGDKSYFYWVTLKAASTSGFELLILRRAKESHGTRVVIEFGVHTISWTDLASVRDNLERSTAPYTQAVFYRVWTNVIGRRSNYLFTAKRHYSVKANVLRA